MATSLCRSACLAKSARLRDLQMPSKISLVRGLLLAIILVSPLSLLTAQAQAPKLDDAAIEQRITHLLSQMTLEEKIAQTVHFADSSTGPPPPPVPPHPVRPTPSIESRPPKPTWPRSTT